jgi:hypothetical protein
MSLVSVTLLVADREYDALAERGLRLQCWTEELSQFSPLGGSPRGWHTAESS